MRRSLVVLVWWFAVLGPQAAGTVGPFDSLTECQAVKAKAAAVWTASDPRALLTDCWSTRDRR